MVYFANDQRTFEEYKNILKRLINCNSDYNFKSEALHNLSVILYYEIKTHNKFIDEYTESKNKIEEHKNNPFNRTDEEKYK